MAFRPQKVKNMITSIPAAAAPEAIMKDAMTLSRSPLRTTSVSLFFFSIILSLLEFDLFNSPLRQRLDQHRAFCQSIAHYSAQQIECLDETLIGKRILDHGAFAVRDHHAAFAQNFQMTRNQWLRHLQIRREFSYIAGRLRELVQNENTVRVRQSGTDFGMQLSNL